jgi:hypothetical protein
VAEEQLSDSSAQRSEIRDSLMDKTLLSLRWGGQAVFGIAILYWARELSLRYNGWTTRFRERNPHINPPPTPEWRERNTKIMTWIFRLFGTFLALFSVLALIGIQHSN